jgi:hypothetical protein
MSNMGWVTGESISGVVGSRIGGYVQGSASYAIYTMIAEGGEPVVIMCGSPLTEGSKITARIGPGRLQRGSKSANDNHIPEVVDVETQPMAAIFSLVPPLSRPCPVEFRPA